MNNDVQVNVNLSWKFGFTTKLIKRSRASKIKVSIVSMEDMKAKDREMTVR